jgi:hypothetical protein
LDSVPGGYRARSSADYRLYDLKSELVLSLFLKRGRFWELVQDTRSEWNITTETRLPPPGEPRTLYPESQPVSRELYLWEWNLQGIKGEVVPPRYFRASNWPAFISACVLYDPPETGLLEFAEYGGTRLETISQQDEEGGRPPEMLAPPLERWPNPYSWSAAYRDFYNEVLHEIAERYLRPAGVDPQEVFSEVLRAIAGRLEERVAEIPYHDVILVDEHTSQDDVRGALNMIAAARERPPQGRRQRDHLISVECAVLSDGHGWSYDRLAERYGWQDYSLASKYVRDGRQILEGES